ncbi:MAG: hypothetical protein AAFU77_13095 [Myxococcota bacterium]
MKSPGDKRDLSPGESSRPKAKTLVAQPLDLEHVQELRPEAVRPTAPQVVMGTSSVEVSSAPRAPLLEQLDSSEKLLISPDEFDDIWQTGVHARAALLEKIVKKEQQEAANDSHHSDIEKLAELRTGNFSVADPSVAGKTNEWERRDVEALDVVPAAELSSEQEAWKVGNFGRDSVVQDPLNPFDHEDVSSDSINAAVPVVHEPIHRVVHNRIVRVSPLRSWLARHFLRLARWFNPNLDERL